MGFRDETKFWLQAPWHFLGKKSEHPGTFLPNMRLPCLSATKLRSFPSFGVFVGSVVIQGGEGGGFSIDMRPEEVVGWFLFPQQISSPSPQIPPTVRKTTH